MPANRMKMRFKMVHQAYNKEKMWPSRTVILDDVDHLGMLLLESFNESKETQDYDSLQTSISEMTQILMGKYGKLLRRASFIIMQDSRAVCASLVTWSAQDGCPQVAFSMTHPKYMNKGMGTFLLKKSINSLLKDGYEDLILMVNEANTPARRIYERIGFDYVA
ncbi:MAG: hypothetical protein AMXMBFR84_48420 [Candidatus Hydrogenedentota bacterium]